MKHVLFYELAEGAVGLAQEHYPAHRERIDEFHRRGLMLLVGTFSDAPVGAMAVFTTREAAEEFMADDPFLRHGVVGAHRVREWDEVLQP
ncbi:YciI family protein [Pseudonocardia humida]|uniref:YCII-related domain-containing protein n=1 Tax=Pseudonocardia humida TaxID=2800819 RepID=A0ABT1A147_9PSEU|nr:YciI family protein [Pseudonocardia humida]MCO1656708.1 hypothetical protein [Pseudonocardia humida]